MKDGDGKVNYEEWLDTFNKASMTARADSRYRLGASSSHLSRSRGKKRADP